MFTLVLRKDGRLLGDRTVRAEETLVVGRDPEGRSAGRSCWKLPNATGMVSREHCEFSWRNDGLVVIDRSSNGTMLLPRGAPLPRGQAHQLQAGDVLGIGEFELRVESEDEAGAEPRFSRLVSDADHPAADGPSQPPREQSSSDASASLDALLAELESGTAARGSPDLVTPPAASPPAPDAVSSLDDLLRELLPVEDKQASVVEIQEAKDPARKPGTVAGLPQSFPAARPGAGASGEAQEGEAIQGKHIAREIDKLAESLDATTMLLFGKSRARRARAQKFRARVDELRQAVGAAEVEQVMVAIVEGLAREHVEILEAIRNGLNNVMARLDPENVPDTPGWRLLGAHQARWEEYCRRHKELLDRWQTNPSEIFRPVAEGDSRWTSSSRRKDPAIEDGGDAD